MLGHVILSNRNPCSRATVTHLWLRINNFFLPLRWELCLALALCRFLNQAKVSCGCPASFYTSQTHCWMNEGGWASGCVLQASMEDHRHSRRCHSSRGWGRMEGAVVLLLTWRGLLWRASYPPHWQQVLLMIVQLCTTLRGRCLLCAFLMWLKLRSIFFISTALFLWLDIYILLPVGFPMMHGWHVEIDAGSTAIIPQDSDNDFFLYILVQETVLMSSSLPPSLHLFTGLRSVIWSLRLLWPDHILCE